MGGFGWELDKNHKHYHSNMIIIYFILGVVFLFFETLSLILLCLLLFSPFC
jgi:hypothetical protein